MSLYNGGIEVRLSKYWTLDSAMEAAYLRVQFEGDVEVPLIHFKSVLLFVGFDCRDVDFCEEIVLALNLISLELLSVCILILFLDLYICAWPLWISVNIFWKNILIDRFPQRLLAILFSQELHQLSLHLVFDAIDR